MREYVIVAEPSVQPSWKLFTPDRYPGEIGGTGTVTGTLGVQDITVIDQAGTIAFDASFNRGGDIIRLAGDADLWKARISGSAAELTDGDTTVIIPVGTSGLNLVFDDGVRNLHYDNAGRAIRVELQQIGSAFHTITADGRVFDDPQTVDHAAFARLFMTSGSDVTVGGTVDLFGTTGAEKVTVTQGHVHFDASFNRGNDTVTLAGDGSDFTAEKTSSAATMVSDHIDVTIPVGTAGMGVVFDDGERTLRFDNTLGLFTIGAQTVLAEASALGASPDAVNNIVLYWNDVALDLITAARTPPPAASRALAMQSIAMFDAIAAVGKAGSYMADITYDHSVDLNAVVAFASRTVLEALFPTQLTLLDARFAESLADL